MRAGSSGEQSVDVALHPSKELSAAELIGVGRDLRRVQIESGETHDRR